ncbi:MAG: AraC family transcriptional regulator [Pseudomonadota bacterium]
MTQNRQAPVSPVEKALWIIEAHLENPLSLGAIAEASGVSPFTLARAFLHATGRPVMHYLRARRLSEAARRLQAGAPSILEIAIVAGYGSHEAFSRAFRRQFGLTPESLRGGEPLPTHALQEPIMPGDAQIIALAAPRMERVPALTIAGLGGRYAVDAVQDIPGLWRDLAPHIGSVPGQIGFTTYGVCMVPDAEGAFDYIAGVAVRGGDALPEGFRTVQLTARPAAVFLHEGAISDIRHTWHSIYADWLPKNGKQAAPAPSFELYDDRFDPMKGTGTVEIWVPIDG